MALQQRDLNILSHLLRYKYMSSLQIKRLFFAHQTQTNMNRILRRLSDLEMIERIQFPRTTNLSLGSLLYLTPKGAKCLAVELNIPVSQLGYKRIVYPIQSINHFLHRMWLVDFWIMLDKDLEHSDLHLDFISTEYHKVKKNGQYVTQTALNGQNHQTKLIPDIAFVLSNPAKRSQVVFFVEIDTGKETIAGKMQFAKVGTLLHKYVSYEKILKEGSWQKTIPSTANAFLVMTVTNTQKHITSIQQKCTPHIQYPNLFLFTTHEKLLNHGVLFHLPWEDLQRQQRYLVKPT